MALFDAAAVIVPKSFDGCTIACIINFRRVVELKFL